MVEMRLRDVGRISRVEMQLSHKQAYNFPAASLRYHMKHVVSICQPKSAMAIQVRLCASHVRDDHEFLPCA